VEKHFKSILPVRELMWTEVDPKSRTVSLMSLAVF